jgi:Spy/CpxP family protein refolding chaperone
MKKIALAIMLVAGGLFAASSIAFAPDQAYAAGKNNNFGGGPGNSGPGDKNGQNQQGHGGQPTKR